MTRVARAASGDSPSAPRSRIRVGSPNGVQYSWLGCSCSQLNPPFFAKDLKRQSVGPTDGKAAGPEPADRAIAHPKGDQRIVLQLPPFNAMGKIGRERSDGLIGHEARHVQGVNAGVDRHRRNARLFGIEPPAHPRIIGVGGIGEEAAGKLGHHDTDPAKVPAFDHRAHVPNQRIAGVTVVHRTDPFGFRGDADNDPSFLWRHCHRLFAQNVESVFQECLGNLEVRCVRRCYGDQIDAIVAAGFAVEHFAPIAIGAVRCDPETAAEFATPIRINVQRTRSKTKITTEAGAGPVCEANLAPLTAANQSPVQLGHDAAFSPNSINIGHRV